MTEAQLIRALSEHGCPYVESKLPDPVCFWCGSRVGNEHDDGCLFIEIVTWSEGYGKGDLV